MRRDTRARSSSVRKFSPAGIESLETRALLSLGASAVPSSTLSWVSHLNPYQQSRLLEEPITQLVTDAPQTLVAPVAPVVKSKAPAPSSPTVKPASSPYSGPYTPAQVRHAYGFDQLSLTGAGQTIAIIDAYDDPTIASDLKKFDAAFSLPDPTFIKATPQGTPTYNAGWADEIALDVEWAHAIAPGATILLVEAASASTTDLYAAVDYAVAHGANQISMSWNGPEDSSSVYANIHFQHPGVSFTAAAGDDGSGTSSPTSSPYVTAVGGTTLTIDSSGNRLSETAWSGSGGGVSTYIAKPKYQNGFVPGSMRGIPDVSYDADPNTGVEVYDSSSGGTWSVVGGTSAGAPQWAALFALVNQGRAQRGKPSLGTGLPLGTNEALYTLAGGSGYTNARGDFFDITSGNNGNAASRGYDLVTGLGSPVANKLVPDLINNF